jgi:hypothetical protein
MDSGAVGRAHPDSAVSHVKVVKGYVGANVKASIVEESTATVQARAVSSATTFAAQLMDISHNGVNGASVLRNVEVAFRGGQGGVKARHVEERAASGMLARTAHATRSAAQLMDSGAVGRAHLDSAVSHVEVV